MEAELNNVKEQLKGILNDIHTCYLGMQYLITMLRLGLGTVGRYA